MAKKFFPIDKTIIENETTYDFNMFTKSSSNKSMEFFKQKGLQITSKEKLIINTEEILYVSEEEYPAYREYYNTLEKEKKEPKNISFEDKASEIYTNASNVLNSLFSNPETLANYTDAKKVVSGMVSVVLDSNFTIKSLMKIASHDYYTHTHSINVTIYTLSLGSYLGISGQTLINLGEAALLHDLGKSKIAHDIINKNGKLTDKEFEEMKKHPSLGYTIALKLGIKNRDILEGIRLHHEKLDGTGYPLKIKGDKIPLNARIIGICDIFDALTSRRSYKEPMSSFDALLLMKSSMKEHIDPKILNSMIRMFK